MEAIIEANEAAAYVIDDLLTRGSQILYDHYLEDRETPYAVSRVIGDLHQIMNMLYIPSDGEPGKEEEEDLSRPTYFDSGSSSRAPGAPLRHTGAWALEEEPAPCTIDTWARGAVPTKRKPPAPVEPEEPPATKPHRSPTTRSSRRNPSIVSTSAGSSNRISTPSLPLERTMSPRIAVHPPEPVVPTQDQAVRARALADMRRREAEREEKKRKEEEERKAEFDANDRLKKELRGKKFTLDEYGNVLMVKRVNQSRMPPAFNDVPVMIEGDNDGLDDAPLSPARSMRSRRTGGRRSPQRSSPTGRSGRLPKPAGAASLDAVPGPGRGRGRGAGGAPPPRRGSQGSVMSNYMDGGEGEGGDGGPPADPFYVESNTVQPPLSDTITLNPGVVLRDGPAVIEGPVPEEDNAHMSRRDFSFHQSLLSTSGPETSPRTAAAAELARGGGGGSGYHDESDPDFSMTRDADWGNPHPVAADGGGASPPAAAVAAKPRKPTAEQRFKAIGSRKGTRERSSHATSTSNRYAAKVSTATSTTNAGSLPSSPTAAAGTTTQDSLFASYQSQDSLVLPPIPGASTASSMGADGTPIKARRRAPREWGEDAARKHASSSVNLTDKAKDLLGLRSS